MEEKPYRSLNEYYRSIFGRKAAKISLDGGFTCPIGWHLRTRGCLFCSAGGSGDFAENAALSITAQIAKGKAQTAGKWKNPAYIAYFQAFTNTYAPVEELRQIIDYAKKPFIIKGIMTVRGALKALEAGAAGIVVSNHGGRVQDGVPATAQVLPSIVHAVKGKMTILVDGGIRSGLDVLRALAWGRTLHSGPALCHRRVRRRGGGRAPAHRKAEGRAVRRHGHVRGAQPVSDHPRPGLLRRIIPVFVQILKFS